MSASISTTMTIAKLSSGILRGEITAESVIGGCFKQIEKWNKQLNAFITVSSDALEKARAVDLQRAAGKKLGPLSGIPIAAKDMFCTRGLKTTAASKILENFVPTYSATVIEKLESAGAIIIGKTNQDEFAMGSSNENSHFGQVRNPWNMERVPGGSSGGSAVAVAANMVAAALGTDTGGSIRQPAGFCGITGVKPTYGRVSRFGIIAFASSMDQAGPMTHTVEDAAKILEVISGKDPLDMTTSTVAVPSWSENINKNVKGYKIGLPKEYFSDKVSPATRKVVDEAIKILKSQGAEVLEVSIPLLEHAVSIYYLIATCEASSNLARYDGIRYGQRADFSQRAVEDLTDFYSRTRGEGFGKEVKRRIILGTYALSSGYYEAYYKKACQVRRLLRDQTVEVLKSCDVILSPVSTTVAFKIGEKMEDPLEMYLNDIFTTAANLAGIPSMSVPAGFDDEGLPVGVQISAAHFQEQKMLNVGSALESVLNVVGKVPNGLR